LAQVSRSVTRASKGIALCRTLLPGISFCINASTNPLPMNHYNYRLLIMFYRNSDYMFEFGYDDLVALFKENPSKSGFHTIKTGLVFKIRGVVYEVQSVMFNFFDIEAAKSQGFDARLIVNTQEIPEVVEPHLEIPDEVITKKK
jgi:hypothetical protein